MESVIKLGSLNITQTSNLELRIVCLVCEQSSNKLITKLAKFKLLQAAWVNCLISLKLLQLKLGIGR